MLLIRKEQRECEFKPLSSRPGRRNCRNTCFLTQEGERRLQTFIQAEREMRIRKTRQLKLRSLKHGLHGENPAESTSQAEIKQVTVY